MGAPSETYVDPSIAGDSGAGTSGDPYGDLQHALDSVTRDATNGDRFNILAGTDEILAAVLDLTTYGTPSQTVPLIFQGYTSAAGDGGQGGIDANGGSCFASTSIDGVHFIDLHIHNGGSSVLLQCDNGCSVVRCELNNTTGDAIDFDGESYIAYNNIYNIGTDGVRILDGVIFGNYFKNDTNDFAQAIDAFGSPSRISNNIFSIDGSTIAILHKGGCQVVNNSIFSNGGTADGIQVTDGDPQTAILSNLIEGFSGTGGVGINFGSGDEAIIIESNAIYNCATAYTLAGDDLITPSDNETLGASPFAKSGADTFANRFTYFAPVDTGNVIGGAFSG